MDKRVMIPLKRSDPTISLELIWTRGIELRPLREELKVLSRGKRETPASRHIDERTRDISFQLIADLNDLYSSSIDPDRARRRDALTSLDDLPKREVTPP
jgi:hypothetical protein